MLQKNNYFNYSLCWLLKNGTLRETYATNEISETQNKIIEFSLTIVDFSSDSQMHLHIFFRAPNAFTHFPPTPKCIYTLSSEPQIIEICKQMPV